jgi:hypothetical protein
MDKKKQFENEWNLWYHHEKDNWSISGYRKLYTIRNISDFWSLYNNWNKIGGINYKHLFLMKNDIKPLWEDPENINGGCWSYKINDYMINEVWEFLSIYLVTDNIIKNKDNICGISICNKKNNNAVVKIWIKLHKNLALLNEDVLKKLGTDIIYIAHMPNN